MGNRVLEIVVYLMDHMRENQGMLPSIDDLSPDLRSMGYSDTEISSAYTWVMERYDSSHETYYSNFPTEHSSNRVLTIWERSQLTTEAYGFLVHLLNLGVIDDEHLESILERATMFGQRVVTTEEIKMITSGVLFRDFGDAGEPSLFDPQIDPSLRIN
jgi:Smg protein